MHCSECRRFVAIENRDLNLCASCNYELRDDRPLYPVVRQMFLEMCMRLGLECPVTGEPITMDSDIHHKKGRRGYDSEEKRLKGISLLIDVDFFLACSRKGHIWIEATENRDWAEKLGYILPRAA